MGSIDTSLAARFGARTPKSPIAVQSTAPMIESMGCDSQEATQVMCGRTVYRAAWPILCGLT